MKYKVTNVAKPKPIRGGVSHSHQRLCRRYGIDAHVKDVEGRRYELHDIISLSQHGNIDRI